MTRKTKFGRRRRGRRGSIGISAVLAIPILLTFAVGVVSFTCIVSDLQCVSDDLEGARSKAERATEPDVERRATPSTAVASSFADDAGAAEAPTSVVEATP